VPSLQFITETGLVPTHRLLCTPAVTPKTELTIQLPKNLWGLSLPCNLWFSFE